MASRFWRVKVQGVLGRFLCRCRCRCRCQSVCICHLSYLHPICSSSELLSHSSSWSHSSCFLGTGAGGRGMESQIRGCAAFPWVGNGIIHWTGLIDFPLQPSLWCGWLVSVDCRCSQMTKCSVVRRSFVFFFLVKAFEKTHLLSEIVSARD